MFASIRQQNDVTLFPQAFTLWSGARKAAVKTPFSGIDSPIGRTIETNLISRLREWVAHVISGEKVPRAIFLVGGAGNGKSEAIEFVIRELSDQLPNKEEFLEFFRDAFAIKESHSILPRTISYPGSIGQYSGLALVQDASVREKGKDGTPQELLYEDVATVSEPGNNRLYLFCVNRGILAQAIIHANTASEVSRAKTILETISKAVTLGPDTVDAWPLAQYGEIAVWPMDIESLVDPKLYPGHPSPLQQIMLTATDANRWRDHADCPAKEYCPFAFNQKILSEEKNRESLIKLLHYYEIVSGKRWNFRELFAITSHLMLGPGESFRDGKSNDLTPCQWVAEKVKTIRKDEKTPKGKFSALFALAMKLYHNVLFPVWPNFGSLRNQYVNRTKPKGGEQGDLAIVNEFFSTLRGWAPDASSDVSKMLATSFSKYLDPAAYSPPWDVREKDEVNVFKTIMIEEEFSYSIKQGLKVSTPYDLAKCERELVKLLDDASGNLDLLGKQNAKLGMEIRWHLSSFACRLLKRSIGTRKGICKDWEHVKFYLEAISGNGGEMYRTQIKELFQGNSGSFDVSLVTTFGQPEPSAGRDARLVIPSTAVNVANIPREASANRPVDSLHFFQINGFPLLLSYELFLALEKRKTGIVPTCLDEKIFSLLGNTKAKLQGAIAKNPALYDFLSIRLGKEEGHVRFEKTSDTEGKFIPAK